MDCSTPGFPVCHQLLEHTQTHVHWGSDAIQPSHSLSSASPPAFNLSQHQGLFQWISSLHQVAKISERQQQSFQWIFMVNFFWDWLVWFPCCPRDSQESPLAPQFESFRSSLLSLLYGPTLTSVHDYSKGQYFQFLTWILCGPETLIFQHTAFFTVRLSHLYMTIGKTIALTIQTFVRKVISLLFNMLSRFVIALLPKSKCLLISWL